MDKPLPVIPPSVQAHLDQIEAWLVENFSSLAVCTNDMDDRNYSGQVIKNGLTYAALKIWEVKREREMNEQ